MPKDVKCKNCRNLRYPSGYQWCKKVLDSPDVNQLRNCNYFCQKTNADLMIEMLEKNDARALLEWWEEILEDGVPGHDYFESWLKQPPVEEDER